jgi:8-oxo-dGTP diphosphatase
MRYTCGFLFDRHGDWVWLIKKSKPKWQAELLNGIGGKIEPGETADQAMRREFLEETGSDVDGWREFLMLSGADYTVSFFRHFWDDSEVSFDQVAKPITEEAPVLADVRNLPVNVIPNLRWIVPMALDRYILLPVHVSTE